MKSAIADFIGRRLEGFTQEEVDRNTGRACFLPFDRREKFLPKQITDFSVAPLLRNDILKQPQVGGDEGEREIQKR